jgi:hypothetical protein
MAGIFRIIGGIAERLTHATSTEATATTAAKLGEAATNLLRAPADRVAQTLPRASELSVARDRAGTGMREAPALSGRGTNVAVARAAREAVPTALGVIVHHAKGPGNLLLTTPQLAAQIARGEHQIDDVAGKHLDFPSQDIKLIESTSPQKPGQTHIVAKHLGTNLEDNVARLQREPKIHAAGGFIDEPSAQFAIDDTIANPANQKALQRFLDDASVEKQALFRVDLGRVVGESTLRKDLDAGHPALVPTTTATVVVIKDPSFPEGYRVLTSYPEAVRPAEVDSLGQRQ